MCTAKVLKSSTCEHWWAEILDPCAEGRHFSNCPTFQDGKARSLKSNPWSKAEEKTCPKCDKKDDYDGEKIRMVKSIQHGYRLGSGPSKSDPGQDFVGHGVVCCTVM